MLFVQEQGPFIQKVARLAKYWNATVLHNEYLSGRSCIFELIGIAAGREEEEAQHTNPSLLEAFKQFLKKVFYHKVLVFLFLFITFRKKIFNHCYCSPQWCCPNVLRELSFFTGRGSVRGSVIAGRLYFLASPRGGR